MIWLVLGIAALLTAFLLARKNSASSDSAELDQAREQLARLEADTAAGRLTPDAASGLRAALDQRVLEILKKSENKTGSTAPEQSVPFWKMGLIVGVAAFGLYAGIGGYGALDEIAQQKMASEKDPNEMSLAELEARLVRVLTEEPTAVGFGHLGRLRIGRGDFDGAVGAFQRAVALAPDDAQLAGELRQALTLLREQRARAPNLSQDQVDAIASLPQEQQGEVIRAMVDGLALRLEEEPNDLVGWQRLIRARTVLGDQVQAKADLAAARANFAGNAEALETLLQLEGQLSLQDEN